MTKPRPAPNVPWRDRPLLSMNEASHIVGFSRGSLYRLAAEGKLALKKLGGRTLVETASLVEALDNAEPWTASDRTAVATATRKERAVPVTTQGEAK